MYGRIDLTTPEYEDERYEEEQCDLNEFVETNVDEVFDQAS